MDSRQKYIVHDKRHILSFNTNSAWEPKAVVVSDSILLAMEQNDGKWLERWEGIKLVSKLAP